MWGVLQGRGLLEGTPSSPVPGALPPLAWQGLGLSVKWAWAPRRAGPAAPRPRDLTPRQDWFPLERAPGRSLPGLRPPPHPGSASAPDPRPLARTCQRHSLPTAYQDLRPTCDSGDSGTVSLTPGAASRDVPGRVTAGPALRLLELRGCPGDRPPPLGAAGTRPLL